MPLYFPGLFSYGQLIHTSLTTIVRLTDFSVPQKMKSSAFSNILANSDASSPTNGASTEKTIIIVANLSWGYGVSDERILLTYLLF